MISKRQLWFLWNQLWSFRLSSRIRIMLSIHRTRRKIKKKLETNWKKVINIIRNINIIFIKFYFSIFIFSSLQYYLVYKKLKSKYIQKTRIPKQAVYWTFSNIIIESLDSLWVLILGIIKILTSTIMLKMMMKRYNLKMISKLSNLRRISSNSYLNERI